MTSRSFRNRFTEHLGKQLAKGKSADAATSAAARAAGGRVARPDVEAQKRARGCQQVLAYLAHGRGSSYAALARGYGVHPSTAVEWVRLGQQAWQTDSDRCRADLVERFGQAFVDRMVPAEQGGDDR